jgi:hypothetical protein
MIRKPAGTRKRQDPSRREVLGLDDFNEADLALIAASHAPDWTKIFDYEMDEDVAEVESKL